MRRSYFDVSRLFDDITTSEAIFGFKIHCRNHKTAQFQIWYGYHKFSMN
jgi:hypothetical protein